MEKTKKTMKTRSNMSSIRNFIPKVADCPYFLLKEDIMKRVMFYLAILLVGFLNTYGASITVTSPNGGEEIADSQSYTIMWTSEGTLSMLAVEYTINDGTDWILIGTPFNTGSIAWTVPVVDAYQCKVRIRDISNPAISDVSDDTFIIFQCIDRPAADMNMDCYVDLSDLAILAQHWVTCGNHHDLTCPVSANWADCDGLAASGREVNIMTDTANCGSCGHSCAVPNSSVSCRNGICYNSGCIAGYADCDHWAPNGCETNLMTSPNNCGACGKVCVLPHAVSGCEYGACTIVSCHPGWADCDGLAYNGCECPQ